MRNHTGLLALLALIGVCVGDVDAQRSPVNGTFREGNAIERVDGAPNDPGLTTELVASGLDKPLYLTSPPGDQERLFVVEQTGRIRVIKNGVLLPTPFLDLSSLVTCCQGSCCEEYGLLGMAFHPDYQNNGYFYVQLTDYVPGLTAMITRYQATPANPDVADPLSFQLVMSQPQPFTNHNGGMLAFGPDGYLYVGSGDGGLNSNAQDMTTLLGKILRLDVDSGTPYSIPAANPFVGHPTARAEIWATGIRNPWRFSFDKATGDLYIGDVGRETEEIDFEPAGFPGGRNYGWNCMQGTVCTSFGGCVCKAHGLTLPIHDYTPNPCRSVTGGYVYRGAAMPRLGGTYFFADWCTNQIWSFRYDGFNMTQFVDRTTELDPGFGQLQRISSFGQDEDGELYMCAHLRGEIYKIIPRD